MTIRIAMWSGPRNLSTAMMRSFGSRADTFVSDEPFYGCFLEDQRRRSSDARGGDRGDGLRLAERHGDRFAATAPDGSPVWYQKHMWHHMVGPIGYDDFAGFTHAFLIREPERMIASYLRKRESAAFEDFGLERQAEFFEREADRLGHAPPVIDANDVLADPEGVLSKLCAALGIAWDPAMLQLGARAAARPTARGRRTGTARSREAPASARPRPGRSSLPEDAQRLADRCRPYYERLAEHRLSP